MIAIRPSAAVATCLVLMAMICGVGMHSSHPEVVVADGSGAFDDADGDMVPDCIELLANTDPARADTDGDGFDDFEEILTFTSHDPRLATRPVQQNLRVLVTSTPRPAGGADVYLHLMMRFVNLSPSQVAIYDLYANSGGREVSLLQAIGYGNVRVKSRTRQRDGVSYLVSLRLSSIQDLHQILPATIGARALLGGKAINTGTLVLPNGAFEAAAVMPHSDNTLILQPVSTAAYLQDSNPYYRGAGRVCEMGLSAIGASPNGTLCEVDWAKCRAAAGLRCSTTCSAKAGTTVVIPGGLGTITGQ
jgi:hypothetical protein